MTKFLVTSGLPYANGDLHIGHVAGAYLPADIFVRFQKLKGNDIIYICGTDEHGAPISIKAESEKVSPQEIVKRYHESIKQAFDDVGIEFDNFSGTSREEHHRISQDFFSNLLEAGFINKKTTPQFYDEEHKRFLPDRYVEGICPHCGEDEARGDQCDSCGKLIEAIQLKSPKSKISGNTPIIKDTTHWFLNLPKLENELQEWLKTKTYWKENVHNFIMSWLNEGLIERAITRDINWGIKVPLKNTDGKVLYVWFDAPIGYLSSTVEWAKLQGKPDKWKDYWLDENCKLIHFVGKDNIPFHTIIWPAMLMKQKENYILPHDVPANEYLSINGKKISTSKNYAIWVKDFVKYFDGEYLRYVLAANAPEKKDSDFSWEDFQNKINTDLANILGNMANRVFAFSKKYFDGVILKPIKFSEISKKVFEKSDILFEDIEKDYSEYKVRKATRDIIEIARIGNKYFDETQPWKTVKLDKAKANETLFVCAELLRKISIVFSPIIPKSMNKLREILKLTKEIDWDSLQTKICEYNIGEVKPLFPKIQDDEIKYQNELLNKIENENVELEHKDEIEFDDFMKMELRIAEVIKAESIKKSKKLLKVVLKIGNETRQVIAGISQFYKPEDLIGKKVVALFNLKPRKVMGIESQAMILSAEENGKLSVLIPDRSVSTGSEIR
ncbi:MAG: methionine--tRNA ligase [Candidatus Cloacimonetes bacterium]|nr:methionine--tRNA ligase [Candidatus Cloacimonadota bacterium]